MFSQKEDKGGSLTVTGGYFVNVRCEIVKIVGRIVPLPLEISPKLLFSKEEKKSIFSCCVKLKFCQIVDSEFVDTAPQ